MPVKIRIAVDEESPSMKQIYLTPPDGEEIELPCTGLTLNILPSQMIQASIGLLVSEMGEHPLIAEIVKADIRCFLCPYCEEGLVRERHRTLDGEEFVGWSCECTVPQATNG